MCYAVSEADEGSKAAELPFHAPNVWPDPNDAPQFRPAFTAYRAALIGVRDRYNLLQYSRARQSSRL